MSGLLDRAAIWLATGLGIGLVTPAPGTIGGLWGFPLVWAIDWLPSTGAKIGVVGILLLITAVLCSVAARALGDRKDPQEIVLDEIVALPIVYLGIGVWGPGVWLTGWLLFRCFDIFKPPPIRRVEQLPAGWGIVADDVLAALYACAALHVVIWLNGAAHLGWFVDPA